MTSHNTYLSGRYVKTGSIFQQYCYKNTPKGFKSVLIGFDRNK